MIQKDTKKRGLDGIEYINKNYNNRNKTEKLHIFIDFEKPKSDRQQAWKRVAKLPLKNNHS